MYFKFRKLIIIFFYTYHSNNQVIDYIKKTVQRWTIRRMTFLNEIFYFHDN